jgi:hypothetical protein
VPQSSTNQPNFALLLALAWLLAVLQLVAQHWATTADALLDTDDAMRLVQMRDFIAGQGWYDLHQGRINPPAGYNSHWSRLIDGRACRRAVDARPHVRCRDGGAADAHGVTGGVAAADHGGRGRDRLAHRRP